MRRYTLINRVAGPDGDPPRVTHPEQSGLAVVFKHVCDAVVVVEQESGRIVLWNPAAQALFGYSPSEVLGRSILDIVAGEDRQSFRQALLAYGTADQAHGARSQPTFEVSALHSASLQLVVEFLLSPLLEATGERWMLTIGRDITERKRREAALRESEARLRSLADAALEAVVITEHGRIVEANEVFADIFGYERHEALGMPISQLVAPEYRTLVDRYVVSGLEALYEAAGLRKDGSRFDIEMRGKGIGYEGESVRVTTVRDISERKAMERMLEHQATHDALTDLPNRALFADRLGQALIRTARHAGSVAVLFVDLDGFKSVNDTFGHEAGDRLLTEVAHRLHASVRIEDSVGRAVPTISRLGGDEFTVLLEPVLHEGDAVRVAERIAHQLIQPFRLAGHEMSITASIGIALGTYGRTSAEELIRNADAAMYLAKSKGKARHEVFGAEGAGQAPREARQGPPPV